MNLEIKGVHNYHVSDKTEEYLNKKMKRMKHFEDMIQDLHLSIERENSGEYKISVEIHFRWGAMHIDIDHRDLFQGIDLLFDKIEAKSTKEKEKIQTHHE